MNQKFQAAVHQRDDVTYVKLGGVIDEDNELADLTERIPQGTVVIDLGEIERINSCGVRDWVNWLGRIEKNGARVVLVECSPSIVSQINLVNNFTGGGLVKSFFAPYFCPNCDREKVLLVETTELGKGPYKAPTCRCDECDGVMDFDDMEDSYFAFLSHAKRITDAKKIQAVVSEFGSGSEDKSKIRSRVGSQAPAASSLGMAASSLPSVPSLPTLGRAIPGNPASSNSFAHSAGSFAGMSVPGIATGRGTATPPPGAMPSPRGVASAAAEAGARSSAQIDSPAKSSRMVYILVAVLIAAICVLALLLFSGGAPRGLG